MPSSIVKLTVLLIVCTAVMLLTLLRYQQAFFASVPTSPAKSYHQSSSHRSRFFTKTEKENPSSKQQKSEKKEENKVEEHQTSSDAKLLSSSSSSSGPKYSSVTCKDAGSNTFLGDAQVYGFPIINRSCLYTNIVFDKKIVSFVYYMEENKIDEVTKKNKRKMAEVLEKMLPPVNLASRPFDLPIRHYKRVILKKTVGSTYQWRPVVRFGPIPYDEFPLDAEKRVLGFYNPIVAPWNYAHTLFCDLFSLFWIMTEFGLSHLPDLQVVAFSSKYGGEFPLPNKNKAFEMFSKRPVKYEAALSSATFPMLLVGSGTKSWSWVTPAYSASGSTALWYSFRQHLINVVGAKERTYWPYRSSVQEKEEDDISITKLERVEKINADETENVKNKSLKISFCKKKKGRGVSNYDAVEAFVRKHYQHNTSIAFEESVGRSAQAQVQMMLDADIFICNEGTLATSFFLMRPGSVFISLPLVYHQPHLHQKAHPGPPKEWWRAPDMLRPDPRQNTGGNIDWFPPAILWVKTLWYDYIPLNETKIQLPMHNLRNYMPDMNIEIRETRMIPLIANGMNFLRNFFFNNEEWIEKFLVPGMQKEGLLSSITSLSSSSWLTSFVGKIHNYRLQEIDSDDNEEAAEKKDGVITNSLTQQERGSQHHHHRRLPNYSINADLCRQLLQLTPNLTTSFNTARCYFSMSWLCEFYTNTQYRWRFLHEKWRLSKGRCGNEFSSVPRMKLYDIRLVERPLEEFLFFDRAALAKSYTTTDMGDNLAATEGELDEVFPKK